MAMMKYVVSSDIIDAAAKVAEEDFRPYAGGTDILGTIRDRIHRERVKGLLSLKALDLDYIREEQEGIVIGSMTKLSNIAESEAIKAKWKILSDSAKTVASPQIRHMATIGGNLCQEPRCWYYRYPDNGFDCLRKGGPVCPAFIGNNVYHSIFGAARVCDAGCRRGCPNETEIAKYMNLIREGDIAGAARVLLEVNPLAAVTGRVCPHTCMSDCNRSEYDEPVAIRNAERFLGDYILDRAGDFYAPPAARAGKKVAVVGAGPAGLTAAYYLRAGGFGVTVFDTHDEIGGMLRYSIPAYRLPWKVIRKLKAALDGMGVRFVLGKDCDAGRKLESYRDEFDAVFVGTGAQKPITADFEGAELCVSGLDFLYNISVEKQEKPGDDVLVIGGGDVAMDVAVSAKRLGAKNVTIVYRRKKELMPAHEEELTQALEEGVQIAESLVPVGVVSEGNKIVGLDVAASVSGAGRNSKTEIDPDKRRVLKADCVIFAIGQAIDDAFGAGALKRDAKKRIVTDASLESSMKGVFAGGDAVLGPATAIEAIAQGRKAAYAVMSGFGVSGNMSVKAKNEGAASSYDPSVLTNSNAAQIVPAAAENRELYAEDAPLGLDEAGIRTEARRCFDCGCVAVSASDLAPPLVALRAVIRTNQRDIPAGEFFTAKIGGSTVLREGEIVREIYVPAPSPDTFMQYSKFRPRKAIDFPVLSVATCINVKRGIVKDAKIVLGAAGPTPVEAESAASWLIGKAINEGTAAHAAELAVARAFPLAENRYKIAVAHALIRRGVLSAALVDSPR